MHHNNNGFKVFELAHPENVVMVGLDFGICDGYKNQSNKIMGYNCFGIGDIHHTDKYQSSVEHRQ